MEKQMLNFVTRISARAVEEQDEIIMRTIQRIGNDIYTDITVDRNKVLEALQDYQEKCSGRKQGGWISVDERLPEPEVEVIALMKRKHANIEYTIMTTAIYEDGTISTEDSDWSWYDLDFNYDEENDRYLIPEGWWEYRHYNPDDVFNNSIDDVVTHWMPLPEAPERRYMI